MEKNVPVPVTYMNMNCFHLHMFIQCKWHNCSSIEISGIKFNLESSSTFCTLFIFHVMKSLWFNFPNPNCHSPIPVPKIPLRFLSSKRTQLPSLHIIISQLCWQECTLYMTAKRRSTTHIHIKLIKRSNLYVKVFGHQ